MSQISVAQRIEARYKKTIAEGEANDWNHQQMIFEYKLEALQELIAEFSIEAERVLTASWDDQPAGWHVGSYETGVYYGQKELCKALGIAKQAAS